MWVVRIPLRLKLPGPVWPDVACHVMSVGRAFSRRRRSAGIRRPIIPDVHGWHTLDAGPRSVIAWFRPQKQYEASH